MLEMIGSGGANEEGDDDDDDEDDGDEVLDSKLLNDGLVVVSGRGFEGECLSEMNGNILQGEGGDLTVEDLTVGAEYNLLQVRNQNMTPGGAMTLH